MNPFARMAAAAIAVVVVIGGVIYALSPGHGVGGLPAASPSPTPAAVSPTPTAAPTAAPSRIAYLSTGFAVPIGLTFADGWTADGPPSLGDIGVTRLDQPSVIMSIASMTVRGAKATDPWVPWPADIHAWLANRAEFRPGATRSITVGGRPASVIDVDVVTPVSDTGDWVRSAPAVMRHGINLKDANANGWRIHLVVVPTGKGKGIVGYTDAPPAEFEGAAAALDQLLTTLTFR
jgi:hypothetical protein